MIENLENEIWKVVKDFEDYQVSSLGRIKSFKYGKEKLLNENNSPYYIVGKYIHILVYESFSDDKVRDGECIHHKNEDPTDNRFENLEKMTLKKHTILHHSRKLVSDSTRKKMSRVQTGKTNSNHKLNELEVINIKTLLKEGFDYKYIHYLYPQVSASTIWDIKNKRSWSHVKI